MAKTVRRSIGKVPTASNKCRESELMLIENPRKAPFWVPALATFFATFTSLATTQAQEVKVLGVEITQAIQGMNAINTAVNNTVPLINGKSTLVRIYFDTSQVDGSHLDQFIGSLYVHRRRGPGLYVLSSPFQIQREPQKIERPGLISRLDFLIPDEMTRPRYSLFSDGISVGPLVLLPFTMITTPMHPNPTAPACSGCDFKIYKNFRDTALLRVRLIGVMYIVKGVAYNTLPAPEIAQRAHSWLSRTYPIDPSSLSVEYVRPEWDFDVDSMMAFPPPSYAEATCDTTNFFVNFIVRERELERDPDTQVDDLPPSHPLRHTHYVGVVYDGTDLTSNPPRIAPLFQRGCAQQGLSDAQLPRPLEEFFNKVGSIPSGPVGLNRPPWYGILDQAAGTRGYWDTDGEYGDWYLAHELGHLFGLQHVRNEEVDQDENICGRIEDTPPAGYPFPNGQLSDSDGTYSGYDSNGNHIATTRSLPGHSWHDIMTYCVRQWPNHQTYQHIQCRINRENNLPCNDNGWPEFLARLYQEVDLLPTPPDYFSKQSRDKSPFDFGREELIKNNVVQGKKVPHIAVLVSLNWKDRTGNLQFITVADDPGAPTGKTDKRVTIRLTDSDGQTHEYPVTAPSSTGILLNTSKLQWVHAVVPFKPKSMDPRTVKVELLIEGKPVDSREVGTVNPTLGEITFGLSEEKPKPHSSTRFKFRWNVTPPPNNVKLFYTVMVSFDGGETWQVAALLSKPRWEVPKERLLGAKSIRLKITASDGFNSTTITTPSLTLTM